MTFIQVCGPVPIYSLQTCCICVKTHLFFPFSSPLTLLCSILLWTCTSALQSLLKCPPGLTLLHLTVHSLPFPFASSVNFSFLFSLSLLNFSVFTLFYCIFSVQYSFSVKWFLLSLLEATFWYLSSSVLAWF